MSEVETAPVPDTAAPAELDSNQPVSITIGDIELTGAGETEASLREGLPKAPDAMPATTDKPSRGQKRFSQLTSERDQEAHKRAEAERERDELKARIATIESSRTSAPAPVAAAVPPSAAPVSSAKFSYPTYTQWAEQNPALVQSSEDPYGTWTEQRADALFDWKQSRIDLDAVVRNRIEADQASRAFNTTVKSMLDRGRASYPNDFDAVRQNGPGVMITLGPTVEKGAERAQMIAQMPNGEHLFYAIARSAEVAHALARMSDYQFGMALSSIAPSNPAASPASTGSAGFTVAPPPMQPVGSGSKTAVPSAVDLAERGGEDYDASGFREQARRERRR
jgi:hypothetical protein